MEYPKAYRYILPGVWIGGIILTVILALGVISAPPLRILCALVICICLTAPAVLMRLQAGRSREQSGLGRQTENLLTGLLLNDKWSRTGFQQTPSSTTLNLDKGFYRVAMIPELEKLPGDSIAEQAAVLSDYVQALLPDSQIHAVSYDDAIILMFGTAAGGNEGEAQIQDALQKLARHVHDNFGMGITAFLGCEVFSPHDLPASYRSALAAYQHTLEHDGEIGPVNTEDRTLSGQTNMIFLDELHLMLGYLINSEFRAAAQVMARVFDAYSKERKPYHTVVSDRLSFFRSTFDQAVETAVADNDEAISAYLGVKKQMQTTGRPLPVEQMHALYQEIARIAEQATAQRRQAIIGPAMEARTFIDRHLSDPLLDLTMLSDELGFSTSYLSRLFKNAYGITILNYITAQRLSMAETLLRETDMTVESVASQVGYSSASSFSRVFQKTHGVSPNQYRKHAKKAQA